MTALAAVRNETAVQAKPAGVDTTITFMSSGDVPRAFRMTVRPDGIDIFDIDNDKAVITDLFRSTPSNIRFAEAFLPNLGWKEFSRYVSAQKEYSGGSPDIDQAASVPFSGNAMRQIDADMAPAVFNDIRSRAIIEDDRDTTLPYRFPAIDRDGAIREILAKDTFITAGEGRSRFCWDVRMGHAWDRSGVPVSDTGEEVDPDHDRAWAKQTAVGGETFMEACEQALSVHLSDEDLEGAGSNGGFVVLSEYMGQDMSFESLDEARDKVSALSNEDLLMLWVKFRSLDVDLGLEARTIAVQEVMNAKRVDFEMKLGDPEEIEPDYF